MLCDFQTPTDPGCLQTMGGLRYSIASSETGNSTDKLVEGSTEPPRSVVLEHRPSVCVQERVAFLPQTGFGSLNLRTAFIFSQMDKCGTCWDKAIWKIPAYIETLQKHPEGGRDELKLVLGWSNPLPSGQRHFTRRKFKWMAFSCGHLEMTRETLADLASCSEPSLSCQ